MYFTRYAKVATCNLNQWALDFIGNKKRIIESIEIAKSRGCTIRLGPELEVPGYGCEDHFLELDTVNHSWEMLADILSTDATNDILCSIGMPVIHRDILYNCAVILLNKKIVLIRPKMNMADDGNYREGRYFTAWNKTELEEFALPKIIRIISDQGNTVIGNPIIECKDTQVGIETCEELWQPNSPNIEMGLEGVEIFLNNSGSHHQLRKLDSRIRLILEATQKNGGVYLYANQRGCDGGRLYYDGASMIAQNGKLLKIGSQFSLRDVEVVSCILDLDLVRSLRVAFKSRAIQAGNSKKKLPRISLDFRVARVLNLEEELAKPLQIQDVLHSPEEEISLGPACYLYDYLRRTGASGYFLPLSGGADSSAVAVIVYNIGYLVFEAITKENDTNVLNDLRKIVKDEKFMPKSIQEIVGKIFFTCYMGSNNSSAETKKRAADLSKEIGANHYDVNISKIFEAFKDLAENTFSFEPKFIAHGGTPKEDLALQNIQARARMVLAYLMSQLIPVQQKNAGFILVLGAANLDEGLRGYMTKYDCSSADINPIGSLSKIDLKRFLFWSIKNRNLKSLDAVINATPTAELRPLEKNGNVSQSDEEDMGMSYVELSQFGTLRKVNRNGPFSMFNSLLGIWKHVSAKEIGEKVKRFFRFYAINRHKMTVLTPAVHAESYSNDDNRYDLRPFVYPINFDVQFKSIDDKVKQMADK